MAIKIYEETTTDKVIKKYRGGIKHRFYLDAHIVLVLVVFEVLLLFAYESEVIMYNGMEFWFQVVRLYPLNVFLPFGTLLISLVIITPRIFHIWLDLKGIKDREEAKNKKDKKKYKPNWDYFVLNIAEGFVYGALIYIFLPPANPWLIQGLFGNTIPTPQPLDANDSLWSYHTNVLLDLALAFGSGFYDEFLFRKTLSDFLQPRIKKKVKTTQAKISVPFRKDDIKLMTFKEDKKLNAGIMLLGAFLFAVSHYILPFSDPFNAYGFVYRFLFGMILYTIYRRFGFPIAMWTHIFYDLWYFALA